MKKHFTILSSAIMTLMALTASFTLTGCGDESVADDFLVRTDGKTVFSNVSDGTRTTLDNSAKFYWQSLTSGGSVTNDQIWVDPSGSSSGSSFTLQSSSSEFSSDNHTGKFFFSQQLSASNYNLSYTGFGSSSGTQVTIFSEQTQSAWNNSDHIGTSGDCATAVATRRADGSYTFTLNHKSSYLLFQPYAPDATSTNIYRLTEIMITDMDGNPLAGTFPLTMDGLQTSGATGTSSQIRLTCSMGFQLPTAASSANTVYAVMLPSDSRNLRVAYSVSSVSDGNFQVYQDISGTYAANSARLISHKLSVPAIGPDDDDPNFISGIHTNPTFGGIKFKPAFLRRTDGTATTSATLELAEMKDDPLILLQYDQGDNNVAPTEFHKRMWFTWNDLAEIFGHAEQGKGSSWANTASSAKSITNSKTIGDKSYKLPTSGQYTTLIETPNSGRATVNYYPASFAAVKVDLSSDATYSDKGWNHTSGYNASTNAGYIMGYLFFPDNMVVLASKIKVASLNGRWSTTYSEITSEELKAYTAHGCMFLPAAGGASNIWYNRGARCDYWSGTTYAGTQAYRLGINGTQLSVTNYGRANYYGVVLVEN